MNRIPITPHTRPGTIRRYSVYKTMLDATVAAMASAGSELCGREGEQKRRIAKDSAAYTIG